MVTPALPGRAPAAEVPRPARRSWLAALALLPGLGLATPAPGPLPVPVLTAAQIVERNAAARGGLEAWRRVQTMSWQGHLKTSDGPAPSMAFALEQERPNKTRFELAVMNQRSVRIFDGVEGWSVRTTQDGRPRVVPFTPQELDYAQKLPGLDGPLIDAAASGKAVKLEGVDDVEGRSAYRLEVALPSGGSQRVWVDARTFLDLRSDRTSYTRTGAPITVSVLYHDYKAYDGLQIPTTIVTGLGSGRSPDVMRIESVAVNAAPDPRAFLRPGATPPRASARDAVAPRSAIGRLAPRPRLPVAAAGPAPAVAPDPPAATP